MGSVIHSSSCVAAQKPHWVEIYGLFSQDCEHLLQVCDSPVLLLTSAKHCRQLSIARTSTSSLAVLRWDKSHLC